MAKHVDLKALVNNCGPDAITSPNGWRAVRHAYLAGCKTSNDEVLKLKRYLKLSWGFFFITAAIAVMMFLS